MQFKKSDIKMQGITDIKEEILNYSKKHAQIDNKYTAFNVTHKSYDLDYLKFIENVKELLQ